MPGPAATKKCSSCGSPSPFLACPCLGALYCSRQCQAREWQSHARRCTHHLRQSLSEARRLLGEDHVETAEAALRLADTLERREQLTEAEERCDEALAVLRGGVHPSLPAALRLLSKVRRQRGNKNGSLEAAEEALRVARLMLGGCAHEEVALSLIAVAAVRIDLGEHGEGLRLSRGAEQIYGVLGDARGCTQGSRGKAAALHRAGMALHALGRVEEAAREYERAHDMRRAVLGPGDEDCARGLLNIGGLLIKRGRLEYARTRLMEGLRIVRRNHQAERHTLEARLLALLAAVRLRQGRPATALRLYRSSLAIFVRRLGGGHAHVGIVLSDIAAAQSYLGSDAEAAASYRRSADVLTHALGSSHPAVAAAHHRGALCSGRAGDGDAMVASLREAVGAYALAGQGASDAARGAERALGELASRRGWAGGGGWVDAARARWEGWGLAMAGALHTRLAALGCSEGVAGTAAAALGWAGGLLWGFAWWGLHAARLLGHLAVAAGELVLIGGAVAACLLLATATVAWAALAPLLDAALRGGVPAPAVLLRASAGIAVGWGSSELGKLLGSLE